MQSSAGSPLALQLCFRGRKSEGLLLYLHMQVVLCEFGKQTSMYPCSFLGTFSCSLGEAERGSVNCPWPCLPFLWAQVLGSYPFLPHDQNLINGRGAINTWAKIALQLENHQPSQSSWYKSVDCKSNRKIVSLGKTWIKGDMAYYMVPFISLSLHGFSGSDLLPRS